MKERNRKVYEGKKLFWKKDEVCGLSGCWVESMDNFEIYNHESTLVRCQRCDDGTIVIVSSEKLYELARNLRYKGFQVFIENDEEIDYPLVCFETDENVYTFECDEVDDEQNKIPVNDREEIVFEVPKGYDCAIEEVDGKSKVIMRKLHNVLKANGLSYDDFELGSEYFGINHFAYKQMKAIDALSYIRTNDEDFCIDNIVWDYHKLCYIGWDDINGNIFHCHILL